VHAYRWIDADKFEHGHNDNATTYAEQPCQDATNSACQQHSHNETRYFH